MESRPRSRHRRLEKWPAWLCAVGLAVASSCAGPQVRRHVLTGQVVGVDVARSELTIAHDPIPGYMDAMTMPFKVRKGTSLDRVKPGDLVRASLVVTPDDGFLEVVETTGHGELPLAARSPESGRDDDYLLEGDLVPDVVFVDQNNRRHRFTDNPGVATVMTFVYTRCPFPTFCPLMDRNFGTLQKLILGNPALSTRVRLVSVTLDPEYDKPAVLRAHAEKVGADARVWKFVTPGEPVSGTLGARFGVTTSRDNENPVLIVHSLATVVVKPSGVIARIFRGNEWKPEDVRDALVRTLGSADEGSR